MKEEDVKYIVSQNKEILHTLNKRIDRIEKKFMWNTIFGFIKVVFIAGPIIFGIIYLSPMVKGYITSISPVLEALNLKSNNNDKQVMVLPTDVKDIFCDAKARQILIDQNCK